MSKVAPPQYDLIIAGGGLVGSSLAIALGKITHPEKQALKIALVELVPFDSEQQASYDERTIALTYSAKLIFETLGVWQGEVAASACPLERIHLSNRGHFGICNLDCKDVQMPALGYVCPTRTLGKALYSRIAKLDNIDVICPASVTSIAQSDTHIIAQFNQGKARSINAKLVVIADGGRSPLLEQAGFKIHTQNYPAKALLSIVSADRPHHNIAFERFTPAGPLALLPLTDQRYAAVWTQTAEQVESLKALDDKEYLSALQKAFGYRAGLFSQPSARKSYPLKQSHLDYPAKQRALVLGNAAHTVHPVGGQGFNLGLRDVAAFAQLVVENENAIDDIGNRALLAQYCSLRLTETQRVAKFTDGLLNSFSHSAKPVSMGRNAALAIIENLPIAKRLLLRRTMGLAKHQPKLARGKRLFSKTPH